MSPADLSQADLAFGDAAGNRLTQWAPDNWPVAQGWRPVIDAFLASAAGQQLAAFMRERLESGAVIYPAHPFRALEFTPLASVRAVVLGQDPYHGPGQAEGLAFSVATGVKLPPSLRNIYKERQREFGGAIPADGSLVPWARQGVLLLNTSLTVEDGQPASHTRRGWEQLTDALLAEVAATASPCVYMLWGAHAQAKAAMIEATAQQHGREALLLQSNHPSPLSASRPPAPFIGNGHLGRTRDWLAARGHSLAL